MVNVPLDVTEDLVIGNRVVFFFDGAEVTQVVEFNLEPKEFFLLEVKLWENNQLVESKLVDILTDDIAGPQPDVSTTDGFVRAKFFRCI